MKRITSIIVLIFALSLFTFSQNTYLRAPKNLKRQQFDINLHSNNILSSGNSEYFNTVISPNYEMNYSYWSQNSYSHNELKLTNAFAGNYLTQTAISSNNYGVPNPDLRMDNLNGISLIRVNFINQTHSNGATFLINPSVYYLKNFSYSFLEHFEKGMELTHKNSNDLLNYNIDIGVGIGKLKDVTDGLQIYFLIQKLMNNGIISRTLTDEEINVLVNELAKVKNNRRLNSNKLRTNEVVVIDSVLTEFGVLNEKLVNYFSILNNTYGYESTSRTFKGIQLFFKVGGGGYYNPIKTEDHTDTPFYIRKETWMTGYLKIGLSVESNYPITETILFNSSLVVEYYRYGELKRKLKNTSDWSVRNKNQNFSYGTLNLGLQKYFGAKTNLCFDIAALISEDPINGFNEQYKVGRQIYNTLTLNHSLGNRLLFKLQGRAMYYGKDSGPYTNAITTGFIFYLN